MSFVHSDSASTSGSSGLCRCLVWDNACGNIYFGLLISVTADAYRFDLRKLIKGPSLPTCLVVQYSVFLQLHIGARSEWSPTEFTTVREWWMFSPLLFDIGKQGGVSVPVKLKNCGFAALKSDLHSPSGILTPVTTGLAFDWLVMRTGPVS